MVEAAVYPNGDRDHLVDIVILHPSGTNHQVLNSFHGVTKVELAVRVADKINTE